MRPSIAIVRLGAANLASIGVAIERAGATVRFVSDARGLAAADGIVVPGVAHFGFLVAALDAADLRAPLLAAVARATPLIGICAGYQLLFEGSDEAPHARGLGILPGVVRALSGPRNPHIGWNLVEPVGAGASAEWAYFAHGFAPEATGTHIQASTTYGRPFASVAAFGSVAGVQFHPERSAAYGARVLRAFVERTEIRRAG
jgi:glutamine amidotransferase